jgi:beta-glucosidase
LAGGGATDEGLLVGYRWYDAMGQQPALPFGRGLSCTTFAYGPLRVLPAFHRGGVTVKVRVGNTGDREGAEVVQLYVGFAESAGEPPKILKSFRKLTLDPGQRFDRDADAGPARLSVWDDHANTWVSRRGRYRLMV